MERKTFLKILSGSIIMPFIPFSKIFGDEKSPDMVMDLESSTISAGMRKPINAYDGDVYIDRSDNNALWIYFDGWKLCEMNQ